MRPLKVVEQGPDHVAADVAALRDCLADGAQVIGAGIPLDWLAGDGISIANLRTADGALSYRLRSPSPGKITLDVPAGVTLPRGGLALRLPHADVRAVRIDGKRAEWTNHEVRITRAPARVELILNGAGSN